MTLAVVLCMTVFSVTAYAGGGDMVDSTMGDPTMETPTATTQPENTNTGEQTPNGQTLTVLVTENADGSHTVTIGDRSWTLPAKREQAGKVVNVRTYLNLRTGPGTQYDWLRSIPQGTWLGIMGESGNWYYVYLAEDSSVVGYVSKNFVKTQSGGGSGSAVGRFARARSIQPAREATKASICRIPALRGALTARLPSARRRRFRFFTFL